MNQREFTAIRQEVNQVQETLAKTASRQDLNALRQDMEAGFEAVGTTMKEILTELRGVREDVVELHDLRARIERLEKKVGFR